MPSLPLSPWTWFFISGGALGATWYWSQSSWRHLTHTSYAHILRGRNFANSCATIYLLTLLIITAPSVMTIDSRMTSLLAALALPIYALLDPSQLSLWHHKKVQWSLAVLFVLAASTLGTLVPLAQVQILIFGGLTYHQHHRGMSRFVSMLLDDLNNLMIRTQSLENEKLLTAYNNRGKRPDSGSPADVKAVDNLPQAS